MLRFKYVRVHIIPRLLICQGSEFPELLRVTYFHKFDKVLSMSSDAVMEKFSICQIPAYEIVTQGSKYA